MMCFSVKLGHIIHAQEKKAGYTRLYYIASYMFVTDGTYCNENIFMRVIIYCEWESSRD